MRVEVRTQAELEAAIKAGNEPVCVEGRFTVSAGMRVEARASAHVVARASARVEAWESSHVEAWGSSRVVARGSAHVVAWESAHVEAWESAHVEALESSYVEARGSAHVEAWGSAHVEAWESAYVEAWESAYVEAWESSHVVARGSAMLRVFSCRAVIAAAMVTVVIHGCKEKITGGIQIEVKMPSDAKEWCDFYGVPIESDGETVILYKGVGDEYRSPHGTFYTPGSVPEASDWDGGKAECGGGLHFSPIPKMTLEFNRDAKRFVACPVRLSDIVVHGDAEYPQKVKAKGCCAPVWECDRNGNRIESAAVA